MGCADLLLFQLSDDAEAKMYTKTIIDAAERSAQLTQQMLVFSRRGKYQDVPVSINEVISGVALMLEHCIDKRIKVRIELTQQPTVVHGDPNQLHNVFLNMALNARDAMSDGGEISFATTLLPLNAEIEKLVPKTNREENYVVIRVHDTGAGIHESIRHKIFEPFFTTKELGKGCGMGLAAAYGSIQAHHGGIVVDSEPGKGTTFTIYLSQVNDSVRTVSAESIKTGTPERHILIVDDEQIVAFATKVLLSSAGYRTTMCNNGKSAVEVYNNSWREIDLVLLDIMLPDSTGQEIFKQIREINPEAAVLLFSGYSHDNQVRQMINRGARGFLKKPFIRKDLISGVEAAVMC